MRAAGRRPRPRRRARDGRATARPASSSSESTPQAFADGIAQALDRTFDAGRHPPPRRSASAGRASPTRWPRRSREPARMVNRHNRLLVTFHVLSDALLGVTAFILAYELRFHSDSSAASSRSPRGCRRCEQYINVLPFIAVLVPLGFQLQGLYRLRRGRSRVDDFFAVFVGSILAVVFGIVATLYVQTYFATSAARQRGSFEVSQPVWAIFLVLNVDADVRGARARARAARAAVARRRRPEAHPDRRFRRAGTPRRRQDHRAPRARLPDRRLRRRPGGRRSPRLSRPAAARHDRRRRPTSPRAKRSITSTSRCRPSSTCRCWS